MNKILFLVLFSLISFLGYGQELIYGSMISYDETTFSIPDPTVLIIGNGAGLGSQNLGREPNFSFGGYVYNYPTDRAFYGGELFYSRHTATETPGVAVSSINLIPQFGWDLLDINLFFTFGVGVGYLAAIDGFDESQDLKKIDIPLKASITYRIKDIISLEIGVRDSVTNFEDSSEIQRNSFIAGVKVPLSALLSK